MSVSSPSGVTEKMSPEKQRCAASNCWCGMASTSTIVFGVISWMIKLPLQPAKSQAANRNPHRNTRFIAALSSKRVDPRHLAPHHQLVHRLGAFVGDHGFEVEAVANRAVFGGDA